MLDDDTSRLVSVLKLSGVTRTVAGRLQIRNRIYERVFDHGWSTSSMPDAELRRQRAAYRRGALRTGAVAAAVLILVGALGALAYYQGRRAPRYAQKSRQRLVRMTVAEGVLAMSKGDMAQSLLWFAEAFDLEKAGAQSEAVHSSRLGTVLRACPRLLCVLPHDEPVSNATFSPDGTRALTASDDMTARVWDATTGEPVTPPMEHTGHELGAATFSPDGTRILTASQDEAARVWDVSPIDWPAKDLVATGQVLSAHYVDDTGSLALMPLDRLRDELARLRGLYPEFFDPRD